MPLIAALIQMKFYGITLIWHCVALSLLMVYINIQSHQITLDPLTKLNNRGHLNKHLTTKCSSGDNAVPIYLAILDVDEFKNINDNYGHLIGDKALVQTAGILRESFNDYSAFLARYGGDEFAVVFQGDEAKFMEAIDTLMIKQAEVNKKMDTPYKLRFSIGYSKFGTENTQTVEEFVSQADRNMYKDKKRKKTPLE